MNNPDPKPGIADQPQSHADSQASTLHVDGEWTPNDGEVQRLSGAPSIEGYRLERRLGEGGMGVVYEAEHVKLKRPVALKLIRSGAAATTEDLLRFRIEAEAVARLQHPNIVQIFDYGESNGLRYIALELVTGGTLAARIAADPQSPREAAAQVELLARAVHAAHLQGIVHRDLKPANILLTPDGTPKVSDFGLAKLLTDEDATASCALVGTAAYMAPEQAWGSGPALVIGPTADVYGLGVILYEMLAGQLPFRGSTVRETLEQIWTQEPPPLRTVQRAIPRDLQTICLKCLQKQPRHRYPSAEALADDLRRYLNHQPIAARPVGRIERTLMWFRRRPAQAALLTVSAAALSLVLALVVYYQWQVNQQYQLAKSNLRQAQQAIDNLVQRAGIDGLAPIPHSENLRREILEAALELTRQLRVNNAQDPELALQSARAQRQTADVYQLLGDDRAELAYHAAIDALQQAATQRDTPEVHRELAAAHSNLGNLLAQGGVPDQAQQQLERSLAIWQALQTDDASPAARHGLAAAYNNLALVLAAQGRYAEAHTHASQSREIRGALLHESPGSAEYQLELVNSLNNLGLLARDRGDHPVSLAMLDEAAQLLANDPASESPAWRYTRASVLHNLANAHAALEQHDLATAHLHDALQYWRALADHFPSVPAYRQGLVLCQSALASQLLVRDELDQAEHWFQQALAECDRLQAAGTSSPLATQAQVRAMLGAAELYRRQDQVTRAEQTALAAARLSEAALRPGHVDPQAAATHSQALALLARLLSARNQKHDARQQFEQAEQLARQAHTLQAENYGYRQLARDQSAALAQVLLELGEPEAAIAAAERVLEVLPDEPASTRQSLILLAQCIPLATGLKGTAGALDGRDIDEFCTARIAALLATLPPDEQDQLRARPELQAVLNTSAE